MPPFIVPRPSLAKWRRRRCEPVASYRILDVCRVELEDGRGGERGHAFTLRFQDWCNVIARTPDDQLVFVWQYRFGSDELSLEVPGGIVEDGEDPLEAARRELFEETGYRAERFELLVVVQPNPAIQDNQCFTFVAHDAQGTGSTRFDPMEELETALVPAARLGDLLDSGEIKHALVRGPLEAFWRRYR